LYATNSVAYRCYIYNKGAAPYKNGIHLWDMEEQDVDTNYIDRAGGDSLSRLPDFEAIVSRPPASRGGRVVDYVFVNYVSGVMVLTLTLTF